MTTSLSGGDAVAGADGPGPSERPGPAEKPRPSGPPEAPEAAQPGPRGLALVVLAIAALLVIGLDLATKQLALTNLSDGTVVRILGGAVYFDLTRNSGAAFSIGANLTVLFPIITVVVLSGVVWLARRLRSLPWGLSMGLIVGGAVGNLLDRLFRAPSFLHGHVVDFISLFAPAGERFAIFNAADSSLFCGVVLAILLEFTGRRRDGTKVRPGPGGNAGAKAPAAGVRDFQREDA